MTLALDQKDAQKVIYAETDTEGTGGTNKLSFGLRTDKSKVTKDFPAANISNLFD